MTAADIAKALAATDAAPDYQRVIVKALIAHFETKAHRVLLQHMEAECSRSGQRFGLVGAMALGIAVGLEIAKAAAKERLQ